MIIEVVIVTITTTTTDAVLTELFLFNIVQQSSLSESLNEFTSDTHSTAGQLNLSSLSAIVIRASFEDMLVRFLVKSDSFDKFSPIDCVLLGSSFCNAS